MYLTYSPAEARALDGEVERLTAATPDVVVATDLNGDGFIDLVVVASAADPSVRVTLVDLHDGTFVGILPLGLGLHELRVVVADTAKNEADQLVSVEVK